jgi:hypothetical protein
LIAGTKKFRDEMCSLRTHARQGSNSGSLAVPVLDSHPPPSPPLSVPLDFQCPATTSWTRPILRPQAVSEMRWPLPHRLLRFPSEAHLTRSRPSRYGNPALQSQGGQDNTTARQIVQGASQLTRPTLSASGAQVCRVPST